MTQVSDNLLRLNGFENSIKASFQDLETEKDLCDITLACDDNQIEAHKIVLMTFSPVFKNLIKSNKTQHPIIFLRKVKYNNLRNLVTFMYQGEVNILNDELNGFLELAEDLKVTGVSLEVRKKNNSSLKEMFQYNNQINHVSPHKNVQEPNLIRSLVEFEMEDENSLNYLGRNDDSFEQTKSDIGVFKKEKSEEDQKVLPLFNDQKTVECDKCGKLFNSKNNLYKHKTSVHGESQFYCSQCNYNTNRKDTLKKHEEGVHTNIRYPCDLCLFKALSKSLLKKHVALIHEGDCYACDQCQYKAFNQGILNQHKKRIHNLN